MKKVINGKTYELVPCEEDKQCTGCVGNESTLCDKLGSECVISLYEFYIWKEVKNEKND